MLSRTRNSYCISTYSLIYLLTYIITELLTSYLCTYLNTYFPACLRIYFPITERFKFFSKTKRYTLIFNSLHIDYARNTIKNYNQLEKKALTLPNKTGSYKKISRILFKEDMVRMPIVFSKSKIYHRYVNT